MSVVALERSKTEAVDFAGLRYVDESRGVFVLNDVFDFVYLFLRTTHTSTLCCLPV